VPGKHGDLVGVIELPRERSGLELELGQAPGSRLGGNRRHHRRPALFVQKTVGPAEKIDRARFAAGYLTDEFRRSHQEKCTLKIEVRNMKVETCA
jgi:hypothetical protein